MTHHLANSLKQDVLHILSALKIYFSLHIWNLSEVHSPSSSSSALQHQCSKQAIHGYRIFFVFQKTITSIIPITFEEWWNKKNLLHHTQPQDIFKINSCHCHCKYSSTFALQRSFVELLTLLLSNGCNDLDF